MSCKLPIYQNSTKSLNDVEKSNVVSLQKIIKNRVCDETNVQVLVINTMPEYIYDAYQKDVLYA